MRKNLAALLTALMSVVVILPIHPAAAEVAPQTVSAIVVRPHNSQQTTSECGANALEYGFIGLTVPPGQVLMLTGIYWGAAASAGTLGGGLVEAMIYVTEGTGSRRWVAPLSAITGTDGSFAGIQALPVPVPLFRGAFSHLCMERRTGIIGTSGIWLFGFFAPDM